MTERRTTLIGALLVAVGSMSMSLYTPAMPALVEAFGVPIATIKLSLTLYFGGFACAQLFVGPLSDAYGRRPVALSFIGLYVAASILAMVAPTADWLLVGRLLQGIGASAGVAVSRAIVRDRFEGQQSSRIMNAIALTMAVGPAVSPTIGGLILAAFGWHAIFVFMAATGVVLVKLIVTQMPETLLSPDPSRFHPGRLVANYLTVLRDVRFLRSAIVVGCTVGSLYASATMLPFVLINKVGLTPVAFGVGMLGQTGSYILGSIVTRVLMRRFPAESLVPVGIAFAVLGGVLLGVFLRTADPTYLSVMLPIGLIAFGISFAQPALTTGALAPFPLIAGSAAALLGFMQTGGGLLGSLAAAIVGDPVLAIATVVPAMVTLAAAAHFGLGALDARNRRRELEARLADEMAPGE
jgi:DHA1 family bicyclomycin/chloramphenicol resistance-like MFS transporter